MSFPAVIALPDLHSSHAITIGLRIQPVGVTRTPPTASPSAVDPWPIGVLSGKPVASIVYRHRSHVINLFVAEGAALAQQRAKLETMRGFNIQRWSAQGLEFFAVSDINAEELQEFVEKFEAAFHSTSRT
jgi:anti-sigma factor RsiW